MNLITTVNVEEANLILNALENAPIPFVKSAPLINKLRESWVNQLAKSAEAPVQKADITKAADTPKVDIPKPDSKKAKTAA